jgi:hypothetical protein
MNGAARFIKVRGPGEKTWAFISPRGGVSRLRIHACRFMNQEAAEELIAGARADDPGWDWKVVPA